MVRSRRHLPYFFSAYYLCIPVGVYKDLAAELVNLFNVFFKEWSDPARQNINDWMLDMMFLDMVYRPFQRIDVIENCLCRLKLLLHWNLVADCVSVLEVMWAYGLGTWKILLIHVPGSICLARDVVAYIPSRRVIVDQFHYERLIAAVIP